LERVNGMRSILDISTLRDVADLKSLVVLDGYFTRLSCRKSSKLVFGFVR
jgi:hypothetical protein